MCLSGAVMKQNSKSIKQLVHPSPWLSPGKIYWVRHTGTSPFLCGWLDTESHTGPQARCYHRAQPSERGWNIKVCSHRICQRGLTFSTCLTQPPPPALEAVLWSGSSFLSSSDLLIFSESCSPSWFRKSSCMTQLTASKNDTFFIMKCMALFYNLNTN